jgi:hypothetical protein
LISIGTLALRRLEIWVRHHPLNEFIRLADVSFD